MANNFREGLIGLSKTFNQFLKQIYNQSQPNK